MFSPVPEMFCAVYVCVCAHETHEANEMVSINNPERPKS